LQTRLGVFAYALPIAGERLPQSREIDAHSLVHGRQSERPTAHLLASQTIDSLPYRIQLPLMT